MKKINFVNGMLVACVVMLLWISYGVWWILSSTTVQNLKIESIVAEASKLASDKGSPTPINEYPSIAQINDNKFLSNVKDLRTVNSINAQVYKDAQDGDYVFLYTTRMIIYREQEKKLVYVGDSPQQILGKSQDSIKILVVSKAKEKGLISKDSNEVPSISVVQDADVLKKNNSFYADVSNSDVIATFNDPKIIVIYSTSKDEIIKSGNYETNIK